MCTMPLAAPTTDAATALPRAILHEPGEDTHRLVYAECLEEHEQQVECERCDEYGFHRYYPDLNGEPNYSDSALCIMCGGTKRISNGYGARAEFIRVQVELARSDCHHPHDAPPQPWCKQCALRARERELQVAVCPKWRQEQFSPELVAEMNAPLRGGLVASGMINVFYSRGFVSSLTLPAAAFTEATAGAVFGSQPVTSVRLSDREPLPMTTCSERRGWHDGAVYNSPAPDNLPHKIFCLLRGGEEAYDGSGRYYPSDALARLALSDAAVTWGRCLAGLPDLPLPRELEDGHAK